MWFDTIIIDSVSSDGSVSTHHIRSKKGDRIPTDLLEQIDTEYQEGDSSDIGPLRMYQPDDANISIFKTKLKNIGLNADSNELFVQLDHYGIKVTAGYYACVFPKGWRIVEINVYDPYSNEDNVAENRTYRDVSYIWDPVSQLSVTQFEMLSNRETFSLGVIAKLARDNSNNQFVESEQPLSIVFSDTRHQGHPLEREYRDTSDAVIDDIEQKQAVTSENIPPVNIGLAGPSVDIVAWGKYLMNKVRKPKG